METTTIIMISLGVAILGLVIFIILDNKKYKHRVEIREVINGRKILRHCRARDFTDDDNGLWWRIKGEKRKEFRFLPIPASESIELDWKGRKCVTLYRDGNNSIKYVVDKTKDMGKIEEFKPLTSAQRVILTGQIRKAETRGGKDWKDNIPLIVIGIQLVILIVVILVFMEDIAKPFIESKQLQVQQQELMLEQTELLKEIKSGVQSIKGAEGIIDATPPPN